MNDFMMFMLTFVSFALVGNLLMRYALWRHQMNEYWKMLEMVANSIERLREEIKNKAL